MQEQGFRGTFSARQHKQLLAPINPRRVLNDGKGHSHVSQQDVTAHLIRVFGFGNFATELLSVECIYETPRAANEREPWKTRYDVAYRAQMRLTIFDQHHNVVTTYEDASTGDAQNQTRADAHDLAMKSAISLAKKRCCINLGDQFGLSLYNKGQREALVIGTHVEPRDLDTAATGEDLQADVPQQESMGIDEIERDTQDTPATSEQEQRLASSLGAKVIERVEHEDAEPVRDAEAEAEYAEEASGAAGGDSTDEPLMITGPQHAKIGALLRDAGITDRDGAIAKVNEIVGRSIKSRNDLNRVEASKVIAELAGEDHEARDRFEKGASNGGGDS